jgi:hypothetical protein
MRRGKKRKYKREKRKIEKNALNLYDNSYK